MKTEHPDVRSISLGEIIKELFRLNKIIDNDCGTICQCEPRLKDLYEELNRRDKALRTYGFY